MGHTPRIKLLFNTEDTTSMTDVKGDNITPAMVEAAQDLIYAMMTGEKRPVAVTGETITDAQITWLFEQHCECRPTDIQRRSHSHDCDLLVTDVCREAQTTYRDMGAKRRAARERCAALYNEEVGARPPPAPQGSPVGQGRVGPVAGVDKRKPSR